MQWKRWLRFYGWLWMTLIGVLGVLLLVDFTSTVGETVGERFLRQTLHTLLQVHAAFLAFTLLFLSPWTRDGLFLDKKKEWLLLFAICICLAFLIERVIFPALYSNASPAAWSGCILEGSAIFGGLCALALFSESQERAARVQQLREAARFAAMQQVVLIMQPHFLLNSLNMVKALLVYDPSRAQEAVGRFRSLFERILALLDCPSITLETELAIVHDYLSIQKMRFEDRLTFSIACPQEAHHCPIPALTVQILVENALKHGLQQSTNSDCISVTVSRKENLWRISVEQNTNLSPKFEDNLMEKWQAIKPMGGLQMAKKRLEMFTQGSSKLQTALNPAKRLEVFFFLKAGSAC